jgi:hypothetical protein
MAGCTGVAAESELDAAIAAPPPPLLLVGRGRVLVLLVGTAAVDWYVVVAMVS